MTDDDEPTKDELAQRVNQLEKIVEKMLPTRRDVLAGAVGAAGLASLTGTASAAPNYSNTDGQYGTDSQPLTETIAKTGTFQTVSTEYADIGEVLSLRSGQLDDSEASEAIGPSLGGINPAGHLLVTKVGDNTASAIYAIDGSGGANVSEIGDPEGLFGTAQGASAVNVYWDGSNYIIEITDNSIRVNYTYIGSD